MGKIICTAFAVSVFLLGLNLGGWVNGTYEGHAAALAALDVANGSVDIGNGSKNFIANLAAGGNMIGSVGAWMFYVSGLLIAVLPLWMKTND